MVCVVPRLCVSLLVCSESNRTTDRASQAAVGPVGAISACAWLGTGAIAIVDAVGTVDAVEEVGAAGALVACTVRAVGSLDAIGAAVCALGSSRYVSVEEQ